MRTTNITAHHAVRGATWIGSIDDPWNVFSTWSRFDSFFGSQLSTPVLHILFDIIPMSTLLAPPMIEVWMLALNFAKVLETAQLMHLPLLVWSKIITATRTL